MGWKEYLAQRHVRYTFEEFGCPEFWVEMRGLESFSHGQSLELAEKLRNASDEDTVEESHKLLAMLIKDWNLTDPETGEPLPIPKEDRSSLLKIPHEFVLKLDEWVAERMNPEAAVPTPRES